MAPETLSSLTTESVLANEAVDGLVAVNATDDVTSPDADEGFFNDWVRGNVNEAVHRQKKNKRDIKIKYKSQSVEITKTRPNID